MQGQRVRGAHGSSPRPKPPHPLQFHLPTQVKGDSGTLNEDLLAKSWDKARRHFGSDFGTGSGAKMIGTQMNNTG